MNTTLKAPACHGRITAQPAGRRAVRARVANVEPHIPERKWLHDVPESQFRYGKPDYTIVNTEYLKNKTANWEPGSLGDVVESVVKTFEFEISHKVSADLVKSFAPGFRYSQNGGPEIDGTELLRRGSYNVLINDESYTSNNWDFEESHKEFKTAFPKGFAWECIEVFSGPPNVSFRWRHWGVMEGPYNGHAPTGKTIEMYGAAVARVNDQLQIEKLEIYYDATGFLSNLTTGGKCPLGFGSSSSAKPGAATVAEAKPKEGGLLGGLLSFLK
ncbi:hypothetical protein PLESTB_000503200 [Pleodorina starrii]|uniref:Pathogen-related protein n=1 Tax=Pleodorina starrii TaxID=330485 RepID=A0A9W6BFU6_9CHLO|nr:hypothetical protein PLESTM_001773300 [Pleodorina starrii]GLC51446.1 hypothetical protein PLESTB_000503200 [Pleodorina starrii]GLC67736.1 hypothetical protein PLESTF_000600200 [Pleodorina starrii]